MRLHEQDNADGRHEASPSRRGEHKLLTSQAEDDRSRPHQSGRPGQGHEPEGPPRHGAVRHDEGRGVTCITQLTHFIAFLLVDKLHLGLQSK